MKKYTSNTSINIKTTMLLHKYIILIVLGRHICFISVPGIKYVPYSTREHQQRNFQVEGSPGRKSGGFVWKAPKHHHRLVDRSVAGSKRDHQASAYRHCRCKCYLQPSVSRDFSTPQPHINHELHYCIRGLNRTNITKAHQPLHSRYI